MCFIWDSLHNRNYGIWHNFNSLPVGRHASFLGRRLLHSSASAMKSHWLRMDLCSIKTEEAQKMQQWGIPLRDGGGGQEDDGVRYGVGCKRALLLLLDWQASFHDTNYLQWMCESVCAMCVELPQVSPLNPHCRGKTCLMEHSHQDFLSPSYSSRFSIFTYLFSHLYHRFKSFILYFSFSHLTK